jgi:hypothetical protein
MPEASVFEGLNRVDRVGLAEAADSVGSSEFGVGALMPWADGLYIQTYVSNRDALPTGGTPWGQGAGLFRMERDRSIRKVFADNGCNPARMVHYNSSTHVQTLFIGICRVDNAGVVTPIPAFSPGGGTYGFERICGYSMHWDPAKKNTHIHAMSMDGYIYDIALATLAVTRGEKVSATLGVTADPEGISHGKSLYRSHGARVYATFNNDPPYGRIGRWNGSAWVDVEPAHTAAWINVGGATDSYGLTWATGHDNKSVVLLLLDVANIAAASIRKFRLPYNTESWKPYWNQEWMRLRQIESERFLLDAFGVWYELSQATDQGLNATVTTAMPRLSALGSHARIVPDFCVFDGALVLGGNHGSGVHGAWEAGQAAGGLEFTSIDELAARRPTGHGYWWRDTPVAALTESEPMLARGFGQACLNLVNDGATATTVTVYGWLHEKKVALTTVELAAGAAAHYESPQGYRCDWFSVKSSAATTMTARVDYI